MKILSHFLASASTLLKRPSQRSKILLKSIEADVIVTPSQKEQTTGLSTSNSRWMKISTFGKIPSERSGHSGLLVGKYMYIFGGFDGQNCLNDLYRFDTINYEWEKVSTSGLIPNPRASYAWTYSSDSNKIYLFGGSGATCGESNLGKLIVLDLSTNCWVDETDNNGCVVPSGYGQTLTAHNKKLYLFGGTTGRTYTNDLYIYDEETRIWKGPVIGNGEIPSPRYKHQAISYEDNIYIIGGGLYDPAEGAMDMYCLNVPTLNWTCINSTSTDVPSARIAHTVVSHQDKLLVFGGRSAHCLRHNEVFEYSISTNNWKQYETENVMPSERDFHAAVMTTNGEMFVFGGSDGLTRNHEMYRFRMSYFTPSLIVLCLKHIQNNRNEYSDQLIMQLPFELRTGLECANLEAF